MAHSYVPGRYMHSEHVLPGSTSRGVEISWQALAVMQALLGRPRPVTSTVSIPAECRGTHRHRTAGRQMTGLSPPIAG